MGYQVDKVDVKLHGKEAFPFILQPVPIPFRVNWQIRAYTCNKQKDPYVDKTVRQGLWIKNDIPDKCNMINGKLSDWEWAISPNGLHICFQVFSAMLYTDINRFIGRGTERNVRYVEFTELIQCSDILSVHVPLTDSTRGMIGQAEFEKMKPSALLINTARVQYRRRLW